MLTITGHQLKTARNLRDLSRQEVADMAGVSSGTIWNIERGDYGKPATRSKIRAALERRGLSFAGGGVALRIRPMSSSLCDGHFQPRRDHRIVLLRRGAIRRAMRRAKMTTYELVTESGIGYETVVKHMRAPGEIRLRPEVAEKFWRAFNARGVRLTDD
jgi:DNA-binding CsgD family transcriptional regulator